MIQLRLYIYTKNIDLHCVSAFESLKNRIPSPIHQLNRYRKCTLTIAVSNLADAKTELDPLISSSYELLNPNKENYHLSTLPQTNDASYCIEVCKQHSSDDYTRYNRLKAQYPTNSLQGIKQSIIWQFISSNPLSKREIQNLHDAAIITTSRRTGLLVNPLFETVQPYTPNHVMNDPINKPIHTR